MLGAALTREPSLKDKVRELFGVDYSWSDDDVAAMQRAGVKFAARYVSNDPGKNIDHAEALRLTNGGIAIVSNWESTQYRPEEGYAAGVVDARRGLVQALGAGMPMGRPIYFSVDYDQAVGPNIEGYFRGANSVLGPGGTGAYGSYRVVKRLLDLGLVKWAWQTYAWSYGQWEPRANIRQYLNSQKVGRMDVDFNQSMTNDFGQWMVGQTPYIPHDGPVIPTVDPSNPDFMRMVRACQRVLRAQQDGIWGQDTEWRGELVRLTGLYGGTDHNRIANLQQFVLGFTGRDIDGVAGPKTFQGWVNACKGLQSSMFVPADGIWGSKTDAAYKTMSPYV